MNNQTRNAPAAAPLQSQAARLFPESTYLQREWIRAVGVVRSTKRGWHLDRRVARQVAA